uniref:Uncharacterized protein n=1 Tax=viral metagenome TaxID=1070528 RepID=A0A6H1ZH48_9ZZZZ
MDKNTRWEQKKLEWIEELQRDMRTYLELISPLNDRPVMAMGILEYIQYRGS